MSDSVEVSQRQLAKCLKMTTRQIRRLENEGLEPVRVEKHRKVYDVGEAFAWYLRRKVAEAVANATPTEIDAARLSKAQADAERAQVELARMVGQLMPMDEVAGVVEEACAAIASRIQSLPGRYGHIVNPADPSAGQEGLEQVTSELLEALSGMFDPTAERVA